MSKTDETDEATGAGEKDARPTSEPALELRDVSFSYARPEGESSRPRVRRSCWTTRT